MKLLRVAVIACASLLGGASWADGAPAKGEHPCRKLEAACEAAGFAKGEGKIHKGLFKNCLAPILQGQAVEGVTVDPADVQACSATRAKHEHRAPANGETPPPAK